MISSLNLPSLSLKPLPLVLSQQAHLSYKPPLRWGKATIRSPRSLLFPRLSSPSSPSLFSQQRGSSPRIIAGASSGPTPTAPRLSCAEGSRAGCRTPGQVSPERGRGAESPSSPCCPHCWGCSPGHSSPSGLQAHIARSHPALQPPIHPGPSQQGCSQSLHPPACTDTGGCPDTGAGPRS